MKTLLAWYDRRARDLPWRHAPGGGEHPDPYAVLVSEIMLQQTTVSAVLPFFERWMRRFPTIEDLAAAPGEEVLRSWEGLGYYSRARNLHAAARVIVSEHGGRVPAHIPLLLALPGVGAYTAGAVASMAFGRREPAVDANVLRVMARLLARPPDPPSPDRRWKAHLTAVLRRLLPPDRPGDLNQALMDLGSSVCKPKRPACGACPLASWCRGLASGDPEAWPPQRRRPETVSMTAAAGIVRDNDRVLVQQRPDGGLLAGMWEFPGGKVERAKGEGRRADPPPMAPRRGKRNDKDLSETPEEALLREVLEETGLKVRIIEKLGEFTHAYTRFRVKLHVFIAEQAGGELVRNDARWVTMGELNDLPMPSVNRRIVAALEAWLAETRGTG